MRIPRLKATFGGICVTCALIVEDEPLVRMATVDLALEAGFSPIEASTADEALEVLRGNPDIAIVVTDVDMPGTLNGAELAFVLRLEFPKIEIVVVSGISQRPQLPDSVPYFTKPLRDDVLIELLTSLRAKVMTSSTGGA